MARSWVPAGVAAVGQALCGDANEAAGQVSEFLAVGEPAAVAVDEGPTSCQASAVTVP